MVTPQSPTRKKWEPVESRLVAEWAAATYPDAWKAVRFRLGAGPATLDDAGVDPDIWAATVGLLRRWADMVIGLEDRVLLVEAKMVSQPVAVGELLLYRELLPHTPELLGLRELPIEMVLLCAREDPAVSALARSHGIRVVVFDRPWVGPYLAGLAARKRAGKSLDRSMSDQLAEGGT